MIDFEPAPLETALKDALERQLIRAHRANEVTPPNLAESIRYSLLGPGKRIRPRMSLACAKMIGLDADTVLPSALALEMVHCFTLIHDDLPCMDDDDFRRGRPSNHKKFGESLALLAGDALIAVAIDTFLEASDRVPSGNFIRALKRFNAAMGPRGVIGGQAAESLLGKGSKLEELSRMHAQKTGALFSAALLVPMDLAGIDETSPKGRAIDLFAQELGSAFQIADDLEDALQDVTQGSAAQEADHTSILSHMSADKACELTLGRLARSSEQLRSAWGGGAENLIPIAHEISQKIRQTQQT